MEKQMEMVDRLAILQVASKEDDICLVFWIS